MHDSSTSFVTSPRRISHHLHRAVGRHPLMSREEERVALGDVARAHAAAWAAVLSSPRHAPRLLPAGALDTDEGRAWAAACDLAFRTTAAGKTKRAALDAARGPFAARLAALDVDGSATVALARASVPGPAAHAQAVRAASAAFLAAVHHVERHNVRLVVATAMTYRRLLGSGIVSVDDLVSDGAVGLRRAVVAFDLSRDLRFSTYAVWWLRHHMRRSIQNRGRTIRIPVNALDKATAASKEIDRLVRDGLTHDEAVDLVRSTDPVGLGKWMAVSRPVLSADAPVRSDGEVVGTLADLLADDEAQPADEAVAADETRRCVRDILGELTPVQRRVVVGRFGLGEDGDEMLLSELGAELGVSRERVRQVEKAALGAVWYHARRSGMFEDRGAPSLALRPGVSFPAAPVPAGQQVALAL